MIRRATSADADVVRALRLSALAGAPEAFGATFDAEAALTDDIWIDRLRPDGNPTFLWEDDAGAHAMAVAVSDRNDAEVVWLNAMWVAPERRIQGVGEAVVDALCAWAHGAGARVVRLAVTEGNVGAERLYERCGFARTGRSERRARDGVREFEMERVVR